MMNSVSRVRVASGVWAATLALVLLVSSIVGAAWSTSALLLLVLGVMPLGVMLLIGLGAPPPTVAEILYAVDTKQNG